MEVFIIGFIFGVLTVITIYVSIQLIKGRNKYTSGTLNERISANNTYSRQGFDDSERIIKEARTVNTGLGNINKSAIESIDNTEKTVSDIIAAAKRKGSKD